MRAVVQRVVRASVVVNEEVVGAIDDGLLVYLGVGKEDDKASCETMVEKIATLRIFADDSDKMMKSVLDTGGSVLVVSQFTLYGDVRRGRRPSFDSAAHPTRAEELYLAACAGLRDRGLRVETGRFRAMMVVRADVDGPITILIDTAKAF